MLCVATPKRESFILNSLNHQTNEPAQDLLEPDRAYTPTSSFTKTHAKVHKIGTAYGRKT